MAEDEVVADVTEDETDKVDKDDDDSGSARD